MQHVVHYVSNVQIPLNRLIIVSEDLRIDVCHTHVHKNVKCYSSSVVQNSHYTVMI